MPSRIESHGDIEVYCAPAGTTPTRTPYYDNVTAGDRLAMVFNPGDVSAPPYALKIVSPSGSTIMDTILRDLPTGLPQSPPPVEFVVSVKGTYRIEIRELKGRQRGEGQLQIS